MGEEFATKEEVHGLRERLVAIERALARQVGPALDIVETAAGFVARAAGGTVGKVAEVVAAVAEKVEAFICPNCSEKGDAAVCGNCGTRCNHDLVDRRVED